MAHKVLFDQIATYEGMVGEELAARRCPDCKKAFDENWKKISNPKI